MARLETQINQIYLVNPEGKKTSLVLHEEQINPSLNLYVLAELFGLQKKSESADLKRISEIIMQSFLANKKLPAETLFETSLSTINQNLADLAHGGRKSWVGKFSCLICVRAADNSIYLANDGQVSAWLRRKSELMEILPAEKRGNHPLKTFNNFTQGKLVDGDDLILTTASIFNYVSFALFQKILNQYPLDIAAQEISKILQDSMGTDQAFCSFFLHFSKKPIEEPKPASEEIYAPLPEELEELKTAAAWGYSLPKLPSFKFKLPAFNVNFGWLPKFQWQFFKNLSKAGKFFLISFTVFLLLFLANLAIYGFKLHGKNVQNKAAQLMVKIKTDIGQTQSALIYKDDSAALIQLALTEQDLKSLRNLDPVKADALTPEVEQVKTQINKINVVSDLKTYVELKHHPIYLASAPSGFLFGNQDSNSLSLYDNRQLTDYFLLNSLKNPINSIAYFQPIGPAVASGQQIFRVNSNLKQFEPAVSFTSTVNQLRTTGGALYALLKDNGQIAKVATVKGKLQTQVVVSGNFALARDLGADKDVYVLYPDKLIKYVLGQAQAFPLPRMSDSLSNAGKLVVASNLYILEPSKKRLIIMNKLGALINQIYFPSAGNVTDFTVDEAGRSIYLLDDNKLYKITF
jgi:hypothetical protein